MDNLSENLFQAIDTIIAARINNLPYDFTKQCKIINIDEANKGIYRVDDGAASFEAYGEANAYQIDDIVRVSVPEGKMELDKFIVGKWLTRDDDIISSKSALESIIDLTGNIDPNNVPELGYDCSLYNSVILTADITSTNMTEKYGINIIINKGNKNETILKLHSDHMIGDPANFNIPSPQEAVFILDAKTLPTIHSIEIGYENAKNDENMAQPWTASNIYLALGNDSTHLDKTVKIFASDKLTYTYKEDNPERTLSLLWYNQDNAGKYIGYSDGEYDASDLNTEGEYIYDENNAAEEKANRYCIRWYKKDIMGLGDTLIEKGWTFIENSLNAGLPSLLDINENQMPKNGNREFQVQLNTLGTTTETYVAILIYNHIKYRSNEIVFTNEVAGNLNEAIVNGISNFKLQHGTNSQTLYDIYDFNTGKALPGVDLIGKTLKVQWNEALVGGTIQWDVPSETTQIIVNEDKLIKTIENENSLILHYSLSDIYNIANINNTIQCEVKLKDSNLIYKAEQTFVFQPKGNNGTPYTFMATPCSRSISAIAKENSGEEYKLSLLLQLSDEFNNDVSNKLTSDNTTYTWLWSEYYPESKGAAANIVQRDGKGFIDIINTWGVLAITTTALGTPLTIYCSIGVLDNDGENITDTIKGPIRVGYSTQGVLNNISNPYGKTFGDIQVTFPDDNKDFIQLQKVEADDTLIVSPIYLQDMAKTHCYLEINNKWKQPIIFIQERYGSSLLNNWDSSLTLDGEKNFIASAAMAAGSKNDDNTFTGVVMGQINSDNQLLEGLFGYRSGSQTFGFKIDGTGFIGGGTGGRIDFDGNRATIDMGSVHINGLPENEQDYYLEIGTQDNYLTLSKNNQLAIKVNNFILDAYDAVNEQGLYLNSKPTGEQYYFKVGDQNNYLSFDANKKFALKVNELTLSAGRNNTGTEDDFYLSNVNEQNGNRLIIGENFFVDTNGGITAKSGLIGGITIDTYGLSTANSIKYDTLTSFQATMIWDDEGYVKVSNYTQTVDDKSKIWINTPYRFSFQDTKQVYISGWGSNTEIFVMQNKPQRNSDDNTKGSPVIAHYYANELTANTVLSPGEDYPFTFWYIIVNKKPTTIEPSFQSSPSSFKINNNGMIEASNAQISGNIKATSIIAGRKSEIVGWSFDNETLEGDGNIILGQGGSITIQGDVPSQANGTLSYMKIYMSGTIPYIEHKTGKGAEVKNYNLASLFQ